MVILVICTLVILKRELCADHKFIFNYLVIIKNDSFSLENRLFVLAQSASNQNPGDVETSDTDNDVDHALESLVTESGVVDGINQVVGGQTNPTPIECTDDDQNNCNDQ
jgi:hypothetical protein